MTRANDHTHSGYKEENYQMSHRQRQPRRAANLTRKAAGRIGMGSIWRATHITINLVLFVSLCPPLTMSGSAVQNHFAAITTNQSLGVSSAEPNVSFDSLVMENIDNGDDNSAQINRLNDLTINDMHMEESDDLNFKSIEDLFAIIKNETAFALFMNNITAVEAALYRNERIVSAFAYSAIIVISLFGNLLVCKVCLLKMTKTNALILSLALSDLSMTIMNIPFNYWRIANYSWPFGKVMCYMVNFVQHLVVYVSSYTMLAIAIYRYITVTDSTGSSSRNSEQSGPLMTCLKNVCCWCQAKFFSNRIYSLRNIIIVIIFVWIISACLAVMFTYSSDVVEKEPFFSVFVKHLIYSNQQQQQQQNETLDWLDSATEMLARQEKLLRCQNPMPSFWATQLKMYFNQHDDLVKSLIVFCTQFLVPLTIAIVLYIRIGKIINEQGRLASAKNDMKAKTKQKQKYRRIMMLVWVVCTFGICWLPLHIFHILTDAGLVPFNQTIFTSVHWFAMLSVMCNPFIYCWLNPLFWASAKKCFCCCFSGSRKTTVQKIIITGENGGGGGVDVTQDIPFQLKLLDYILCCRQYAPANVHQQYVQHKAGSPANASLARTLLSAKPSNMSLVMVTDTTMMPLTAVEPMTTTVGTTTKLGDEQQQQQQPNINPQNFPSGVAGGDQLESSNEDNKLSNTQINIVCNTQYESMESCQQRSHPVDSDNASRRCQRETIQTGDTDNDSSHGGATQSHRSIRLAIYRENNPQSLQAGLLSPSSSECIELQPLTP